MTCAKLTTRATIIAPDGERFVGTNAVRNPQATCPREGMPTGVGYELCKSICDQPHHAEVAARLAAGEKARGGTLYLEGHYYACEPCKRICEEHGVSIVIGAPPGVVSAFGHGARIQPGTRVQYNCIEFPFLGRIIGTVRQMDVTGRHLVHFDCGHADWIVPQVLAPAKDPA